jgi:hypothetical protein
MHHCNDLIRLSPQHVGRSAIALSPSCYMRIVYRFSGFILAIPNVANAVAASMIHYHEKCLTKCTHCYADRSPYIQKCNRHCFFALLVHSSQLSLRSSMNILQASHVAQKLRSKLRFAFGGKKDAYRYDTYFTGTDISVPVKQVSISGNIDRYTRHSRKLRFSTSLV